MPARRLDNDDVESAIHADTRITTAYGPALVWIGHDSILAGLLNVDALVSHRAAIEPSRGRIADRHHRTWMEAAETRLSQPAGD